MRRAVLKSVNILLCLVGVGLAAAAPLSYWYDWPVQAWVCYLAYFVVFLVSSLGLARAIDEIPPKNTYPGTKKRQIAGRITMSLLFVVWALSMAAFATTAIMRSGWSVSLLIMSGLVYLVAGALVAAAVFVAKSLFGANGDLVEERSRRMSG